VIDANDEDQAAFTIDGEQTTIAVMRIDADVLTTNSVAVFSDDSVSTSSRDSVQVLQDNSAALAATALYVQSDGGITGMQIDKNYTDVAAATVTGLHVDFDRTAASGSANFTDIGINLDVNAGGSTGTVTTTGMDIDVVGSTDGTHTAIGLDVTVGSGDTNIAARFTGGEVALLTTTKLSFHDVGGGENIVASADGHLEINSETTLDITAPTVDINASTKFNVDGATQLTGAVTVGVDDTGYDVKFFGATSGAFLEWDEDANELELRGGAATPGKLLLSTAEATVVDGNKLGQIDFQAPAETGTDAIVVGASIVAEADATFTASVNSTDLVFLTADSGAATEKFRIDSTGQATFADGAIDVNIASHDGTNGLALAGTVVTASAADINLLLDAGTLKEVGKETIWTPATAMRPSKTNGCASISSAETTSGRPDMNVLKFDPSSDEFAQFMIAFPKSWNLGTVTYQVFWSGAATTTGVTWMLDAVSVSDDGTIDVAYGTNVTVDDNVQGAVEELCVSSESGALTIAGTPADGDLCFFRIGRDVSDSNDTMGDDAHLHGIKIFFTTDAANDA